MTTTLIILVITVALFIWGRVRADIVALTALAALLVLGILTPAEPLAFFSFFPVGIIVIAIGIIVLMPLCKIFLSKKQSGKKKKQGKSLDDLRSSAPFSLLRIFDIKIKVPDARFLASGALFLLW